MDLPAFISQTLIAKHLEGLHRLLPGSEWGVNTIFRAHNIKETYYILFDLGFTIALHYLQKYGCFRWDRYRKPLVDERFFGG